MKKILAIFLCLISVSVFAQKQNITGKVTNSAGEPLPSVTIVVKGTKTGTTSDADGNFSLANVPTNATLVFSFVGLKKEEIKIGNSATINLTMLKDVSGLDEVVIIGYGTVKKKDLTGSVSSIKASDAYVAPAASLDVALQGRATGVQVTTTNGEPGSPATIRIRGGNSITAGNEPLYVIDGFIGGGNLSTLNPGDIESIEVLKDASSTAIYGSRGANGVILITTKKGSTKGKALVNLKTSAGIDQLPQQIAVQSGYEFAAWRNSQAADQNNLPFNLNNLPGEQTNWQDVLTRNAKITDNNLSITGGNDKTQYYTSVGYLAQQGIVKNTDFNRFSLRTNLDTRLSKIFKTGFSLSLSRTNNNNDNTNFTTLMRADPLKPVYNADGTFTSNQTYGVDNAGGVNIAATNQLILNETIRNRGLINTYVQAQVGKFTWKSTFGADVGFNRTNIFTPSTLPSNIVTKQLASASIAQNSFTGLLNENTLDYNAKFGNHKIELLGGATIQTFNNQSTLQTGSQIPSDGVGVYGMQLAPQTNISMSSGYTKYSIFSLLGRANYSFKGKYFATATIRRDGSSVLGLNNQYAVFPSVGLGWNISEEPFFKNFSKLDYLKLRTSYGISGNSGVSPFSTLATVSLAGGSSIIDGVLTRGVGQGSLATPNLKWETTATSDVALETSFFKGRLSTVIDFYYKKTTNLILAADVPLITGFSTTLQNVGSLENRGLDFSLTGVPVQTNDFEISTTVNISTFKNKVTNLGIKPFIKTVNLGAPANDEAARLIVGQPVGTFWGYIYDGVNPTNGEIKYKDIAGPVDANGHPTGPDGIITADDKTIIGHANPDYYGGISLDVQYKNFGLNTFFPFSVGGQNYNEQILQATEVTTNSFSYLRDRMWSAANPNNALIPKAGSTLWNKSNSLFIQDASYFRLGTLQLSYTLPSNLIKGITNFRFYVTGSNLFLAKTKNYLGFDPDVSSYGTDNVKRGFDNVAYPRNRSLLFGLDISL